MRRLALLFLVGLGVILQISLLPALNLFGVVPNLVLVVVVLVCLRVATSQALVAAALSGLVLDLASGANFGLWTGVMVLVALVVGMAHRAGIEQDRIFVAPVLVVAGTLLITLVIWVSLIPKVEFWPAADMAGRLGVELVINLLLTMALRPAVGFLLGSAGPQSEPGV